MADYRMLILSITDVHRRNETLPSVPCRCCAVWRQSLRAFPASAANSKLWLASLPSRGSGMLAHPAGRLPSSPLLSEVGPLLKAPELASRWPSAERQPNGPAALLLIPLAIIIGATIGWFCFRRFSKNYGEACLAYDLGHGLNSNLEAQLGAFLDALELYLEILIAFRESLLTLMEDESMHLPGTATMRQQLREDLQSFVRLHRGASADHRFNAPSRQR